MLIERIYCKRCRVSLCLLKGYIASDIYIYIYIYIYSKLMLIERIYYEIYSKLMLIERIYCERCIVNFLCLLKGYIVRDI